MNSIKRLSGLFVMLTMALVMFGLSAQSTQAQTANWKSQFFNNPYLSGDVVRTDYTNQIAFNWGAGSPANVPNDNFSARISTDIFLEAGTYRFWVLADDGVTFYFDFQKRIDTFENTRPGDILQTDVTVNSGVYHIQIDYREFDLGAYVYVDYTNMGTNPRGPNFPVNVNPTPVPGGTWTAEYFANNSITGSPSSIVSETGPSHNWGTNAPALSLPADNFSVRWTTQQYFDGSVYQVAVRADDGVRVYFDNILYIDQWTYYQNQTFTANVQMAAGIHNVRVEYREFTGDAFIEYALTRQGTVNPILTPTPQLPVTGASATVTSYRLNVRNAPSTISGTVITQISIGQTYPLTGRTADFSWYQINLNGTIGWVNAGYVNTINAASVPVVNGNSIAPLPATGFTLTTTANLNIRNDDSLSGTLLGRIPNGNSAQILARNASNTWYFVRYNGLDGWVSASWVRLGFGTDVSRIPVR